jgi:acetylglutamate kinase
LKVLIKLGGTLLDEAGSRRAIARQIAEVARDHEVVVVHGGGKQVTRYLEERGVATRFVGGLRVSDEAVIDAVTKVIAGSVNKQLVSAVIAAGRLAVGLSGVDGTLTSAAQLDPSLGFVGKPQTTEPRLLNLLVGAAYVPVVACIAGDDRGNVYNVNADQMAVSCAVGWRAERLLFLTDVPGVKGSNGRVIPQLADSEIQGLIDSKVAHGGMQAKLEAAGTALASGLAQVIIAPGHESDVCQRLLRGEVIGTRLAQTSAAAQVRAM